MSTAVALAIAAIVQAVAIGYGLLLLRRQITAAVAWLWLLGGMMSMLAWRIVVLADAHPPAYFNPVIGIWGSTCMGAAMYFFGREIERRRRAEAERDILLDSERAARQAADRANRLKDDFLATLSHELRTPLAAILGWCAVLRRRPDAQGVTDLLGIVDTIERNAQTQVRLVEDMLDMTRLQANSLQLLREPLALEEPVRTAVQSLQPLADAKSIDVEFVCDGSPAVIEGDRDRIQQIAGNLIVNAIKFTGSGGRVLVSLKSTGGVALLQVADTGEGIDPKVLPHIFEPFRQGDSSVARRHGGVGLGLSIVANLVRMHGGNVRAESRGTGSGATFTVELPLAPRGALLAPSRHQESERLEGMRVMVIDDEEDVREAVARMLEQSGARVLGLATAAGVEHHLVEFVPDVLVIDIGMPGEDGYSLIRRIRKLAAHMGGQTPAVSLTAHARAEDREHALEAGFQEHLPKPVDLRRLTAVLRRHARRPVDSEPENRPGDLTLLVD
jgi:signal transduction histidine kinase/CheY-like chemotaxis protein